ncbi:hypothetical protein ACROYT_G017524 [Oculina patagonica]
MSAYGLNLTQDPLESASNVEEVTEGKEEEVIEEYDFDSDSSLSLSHLSEDDDEQNDALLLAPAMINFNIVKEDITKKRQDSKAYYDKSAGRELTPINVKSFAYAKPPPRNRGNP